MKGACSAARPPRDLERTGIENLLRHFVPEIRGVEQA